MPKSKPLTQSSLNRDNLQIPKLFWGGRRGDGREADRGHTFSHILH